MRHTHEVEVTGQRPVHWLRAAAFVVGIAGLAWMCSVLFASAAEAASPAAGLDGAGDVLPSAASQVRDAAPAVREATGRAQKVTRPVEQSVQRTVRRAVPERPAQEPSPAPVAQPVPQEPSSSPDPGRDSAAQRETRPQAQRPGPVRTLAVAATDPVRVATAGVRDRTAPVVRTTLEAASPTLREVTGAAGLPGLPAVPEDPEVPELLDLTQLLPAAATALAPQAQPSSVVGRPSSAESASVDATRSALASPRSTENPSAPAPRAVDAASSGESTYDASVPVRPAPAVEDEREAPSLPTIPATSGAVAAAPGAGQGGGQGGTATLPETLFLPAVAAPDQASTRLASSLPEPGSRPGASPD